MPICDLYIVFLQLQSSELEQLVKIRDMLCVVGYVLIVYVPHVCAAMSTDGVSASIIAATETAGCHLLKIDGYSRTKMVGNGACVWSSESSRRPATHGWRVSYYLDGSHEEDAGHVSLYLRLTDERVTSVVHDELLFSLVPHHGKPNMPNMLLLSLVNQSCFC